MTNQTCATCLHRVSDGRRAPRVCLFDGAPAPHGQPCRHGKWTARRVGTRQPLPFTGRPPRQPMQDWML